MNWLVVVILGLFGVAEVAGLLELVGVVAVDVSVVVGVLGVAEVVEGFLLLFDLKCFELGE